MQFLSVIMLTGMCFSCARMGNPDGGWFDEVPPRVVGATPGEYATKVHQKRITINFSEFVNIDNPTENVVICPPQLEAPDISARGKSVRIDLKDSLKANTTYTIDFSDAITDFNEGNPMGNYTYVFSTGDHIDTLEVSGYVLNAEDLEPVKGQLVGLHNNLADSAFTTTPLLRTGRTDGSGHFIIRGVAPGSYRIYSLEDGDANFMLSQRGERLGFSHDIIVPTSKPDIRQDTIWADSLHIRSIERVPYTHFLPDDICLMSFVQAQTERYLIKTERKDPDRINIFFSTPSDSLPHIRGLNFNEKDAFLVESNGRNDTLTYWLRDTTLINQDTLRLEMTYLMTDTLGALVSQTDTLELQPKVSYEKRMKDRNEKIAKWEKQAEKDRKKGREPQPMPRENILEPKLVSEATMAPNQNVLIQFTTPLERIDTAGIHLYSKIDTLWYNAPMELTSEDLPPRTYAIKAEWRPGIEYSLEVDSAAFVDIYGNVNDAVKKGIAIGENGKYSSLFVYVEALTPDSTGQILVQMLGENGDAKYSVAADKDGLAEFYYVKPGTYYVKAINDRNSNGKWDTGDYSLDLQAEDVYYYDTKIECKEKRDVTAHFNVKKRPRYLQKPSKLIKQKSEQKKKTIKERNAKRAQELNILYDKDKVNSKF